MCGNKPIRFGSRLHAHHSPHLSRSVHLVQRAPQRRHRPADSQVLPGTCSVRTGRTYRRPAFLPARPRLAKEHLPVGQERTIDAFGPSTSSRRGGKAGRTWREPASRIRFPLKRLPRLFGARRNSFRLRARPADQDQTGRVTGQGSLRSPHCSVPESRIRTHTKNHEALTRSSNHAFPKREFANTPEIKGLRKNQKIFKKCEHFLFEHFHGIFGY